MVLRTQFREDGIQSGLAKNAEIVDRIYKCRHEISVWKKANPPYGKEKISTYQRALEEIQNDFTKSNKEVWRCPKNYKKRIEMRNNIENKKLGLNGIHVVIEIQNSIMLSQSKDVFKIGLLVYVTRMEIGLIMSLKRKKWQLSSLLIFFPLPCHLNLIGF